MEKFKKLTLSILISAILIAFMLILVLKSDGDISKIERRKLLKQPSFSIAKVLDKRYFPNYEKYLLDQFPFRDQMRSIKAFSNFYLLREKDNDGIFWLADNIFKAGERLDEKQVRLAVKKIETIIASHPEAKAYYYALIPDKICFSRGYPSFDCNHLLKILNASISKAKYIDIASLLTLNDYYRTDAHWSSAKIEKIAQRICTEITGTYLPLKNAKTESIAGFYGAYYGQLALPVPSENLDYLNSDSFDNVTVTGIDQTSTVKVYNKDNFFNIDPYDFFLGGAQPILFIENKNAKTDKSLIIFRDSFTSSLAPLLVENYRKISLVDIRYISSESADKLLNYNGADVLFIYSSRLWNNGGILK